MKDRIVKQIKEENEKMSTMRRLSSRISILRLICFLAAVIFVYLGFSHTSIVFGAAGILCLAGFVVFIWRHGVINERLQTTETKISVMERYLKRLSDGWRDFENDGSEFLTREDTLSKDIDLLGRGSLYQLISVAHTPGGKKRLADIIKLRDLRIEDRDRRYEAIAELSHKDDFRFNFETAVSLSSISERQSISPENDKYPLSFYILMMVVPVMNILSLILVFAMDESPAWILLTFIMGLIFTWTPRGVLDKLTEPLISYGPAAAQYARLLGFYVKEDFSSELLSELKKGITQDDGIIDAIKGMEKIQNMANISYNPIIHMLLSGFVGWDFHVALKSFKWQKENAGVFDRATELIAETEELMSLSVLSVVRKTTEPVILSRGNMLIECDELYHPLLDTERAVANTVTLDNKLTIITGSNMSGKTTFMRTVAINAVLAYTGAGVTSKHFAIPVMKLFTSMRITDDVSGGISTFYAEILRIKAMADYTASEEKIPALCMIDEIFKGTNSADRIVGATEAIRKLSKGNCMIILTTHDFELCDIKTDENNTLPENYHFEEYYEDDSLKFDYKIKEGPCKTRNAIALLKMAGIVQN